MDRQIVQAFANQPTLLDGLSLLEEELRDIEHDETDLRFHKGKKCVVHQFKDEWEMEYIVLQHWSDHTGIPFKITEEPDKKGLFSAFILL